MAAHERVSVTRVEGVAVVGGGCSGRGVGRAEHKGTLFTYLLLTKRQPWTLF
jgi:hypothetical protein